MSVQEGQQLFFAHLGRSITAVPQHDVSIATSLSQELGGLPMALAHLAGYISQSQTSLESFRLQFHRRLQGSEIWNSGPTTTTAFHSQRLGALWDIAINALDQDSRELLEKVSFLNPDAIPEELLLRGRNDTDSVAKFNRAIADLRKRCLIDRSPNSRPPYVSVHRALQRNMTFRLDSSGYVSTFVQVFELVRSAFPRRDELEIPDHHNWGFYEQYLPQVLSLQERATDLDLPPGSLIAFADMLSDAGHFLWHRGDLQGAADTLQAAEKMCRRAPEHVSASTLASVATGLQAVANAVGVSKRKEAIEYAREAVRLRVKYRVADPHTADILLANAWHDLGCTYLEAEEYARAEDCLNSSMAIKKQIGTEDSMPFEFATEYEDLAYVRLSQGRTQDALDLIQDAVRVAKSDEAANRAVLLQFVFDWAVILLNSG